MRPNAYDPDHSGSQSDRLDSAILRDLGTRSLFPWLADAAIDWAIIAAALVSLTFVIGRKVSNKVKDTPYECGINPLGDARERFSVKFYLVGMIFILFDIEAVFLYPWVVVYRDLKLFGFFEMLIFVVLVLVGFYYTWKKGALDWSATKKESK